MYTLMDFDIGNQWRYWNKEPIDGGYSWFRYVIERNSDGQWTLK